jgi:ParB family chromosome partitioning protein
MIQFDQASPREGFFMLDLAAIEIDDRLRPADPAEVEAIAASMAQVGQITPIRVRNGEGNRVILVAGLHRLRAAEALGWTAIKAERVNLAAAAARLVEIDENLIRHELTALDRAIFLAERKRIYEELHPQVRHGGDRRRKVSSDQVAMFATCPSFTADAMQKTGLGERSIQYAVRLAERLTPTIIAHLRASGVADNGAQLKQLVDIEDDTERLAVAAALAGGAANVERARVAAGFSAQRLDDPEERAFQSFLALWHRAGARTRQRITAHITQYDTPGPAARKAAKRGDGR